MSNTTFLEATLNYIRKRALNFVFKDLCFKDIIPCILSSTKSFFNEICVFVLTKICNCVLTKICIKVSVQCLINLCVGILFSNLW